MDFTYVERLGNLHLVLLHLPIGLLLAILLVEFCRRRHPDIAWLQGRLLALNAVAALAAAGFGLLLAGTNSYPEDALSFHRWAGVVCAGFAVAAFLAHRSGHRLTGRIALGLLVLSTAAAGHLGAVLTHGPEVANFWMEKKEPSPTRSTPEPDMVHTILQKHCFDCHGNGKSKGGLRLDTSELARKGGKSGKPAAIPGKPKESEMIIRIKLPREQKKAMPPWDREGLSEKEISTLEAWIAGGAR